jgi:hypothetical protein
MEQSMMSIRYDGPNCAAWVVKGQDNSGGQQSPVWARQIANATVPTQSYVPPVAHKTSYAPA